MKQRQTQIAPSGLIFSLAGVLLLLGATLALQACKPVENISADERPVAQTETDEVDSIQADLSFDPLGAEGDILNIPSVFGDSVKLQLTLAPFDSMTTSGAALDDSDRAPILTPQDTAAFDTYRIQLYNSRVYSEAALERSVATEIFDHTVTLDYEVPYFKVRLGDFEDARIAKEYLKEYVKPAGYPDSWVARVRVTPQKSAAQQALLTAYFDSLRTAILLEGLDIEALDSLGVLDSLLGDTAQDTTSIDSSVNDTEGGGE